MLIEEHLVQLEKEINHCYKCHIAELARTHVIYYGATKPKYLFIGEAPGVTEDHAGIPFIGDAGQVLHGLIHSEQIHGYGLLNILKCHPPGNRDPKPDEVKNCMPFLKRQIYLYNPKIIILLGRVAAKALIGREVVIIKERGWIGKYYHIPMYLTYHPGAIVRDEKLRKFIVEDFRKIKSRESSNYIY